MKLNAAYATVFQVEKFLKKLGSWSQVHTILTTGINISTSKAGQKCLLTFREVIDMLTYTDR